MTHDVCGLAHAARVARRKQLAAQDEAADAELLAPFLSPDPDEDPEDPDEDEPELDEPESDEEDDFDESEEPEPEEPEEPSVDDPDFASALVPDGSLSLPSLSFLPGPSPFEPLRLSVR
jgi:hypothetical protein